MALHRIRMIEGVHLTALLGVSTLAWAITLWFNGVPLSWALLLPFGTVVTVCSFALLAFDKWIWKWKPLHGWFVRIPNLQGSWKAKLESSWENPATGERVPPIDCFMVLRQSYSTLSIRLMTPESVSVSCVAKIVRDFDGTYEITCVYRNEPKSILHERSQMHYGGMRIFTSDGFPSRMAARYWTDRKTTGDITLTDRRRTLHPDFETALLGHDAAK